MTSTILGLLIGIAFIFSIYLGFHEGLRLGMKAKDGEVPPKIRSPVEAVKDIRRDAEISKLEKESAQSIKNWLEYDGNPQPPNKGDDE